MRAYFDLIQYLESKFRSDNQVGTISSDGFIDMDNWRKNIYPLVDIYVVDSPLIQEVTSLSRFNVEIICLDIRDVNKEDVNDKFWHNDNRHDNWNLTHAILEKAKDSILKDTDSDITIESLTSLERVVFGKENGLDGWRTTWSIDVPKTYNGRC